ALVLLAGRRSVITLLVVEQLADGVHVTDVPLPRAQTSPIFCFAAVSRYFGRDAVDLVSHHTDVCGAALTDEVDAPAETGAGADVTAPSDHPPVPAPPPRRYRVRRGMLAALAVVVLVSVIVVERHT